MCLRRLSLWVYSTTSAQASSLDRPIKKLLNSTTPQIPTNAQTLNSHKPPTKEGQAQGARATLQATSRPFVVSLVALDVARFPFLPCLGFWELALGRSLGVAELWSCGILSSRQPAAAP